MGQQRVALPAYTCHIAFARIQLLIVPYVTAATSATPSVHCAHDGLDVKTSIYAGFDGFVCSLCAHVVWYL
jgi:hypothetical protein